MTRYENVRRPKAPKGGPRASPGSPQRGPNVTKQKWPLLGDVGRTDVQAVPRGPDVTKQKGPLLGDVGRTSGVPERGQNG